MKGQQLAVSSVAMWVCCWADWWERMRAECWEHCLEWKRVAWSEQMRVEK